MQSIVHGIVKTTNNGQVMWCDEYNAALTNERKNTHVTRVFVVLCCVGKNALQAIESDSDACNSQSGTIHIF